jgi:predicted transposase YdaD
MLSKEQIRNLFEPFHGLNPKESNVYKFFLEEGEARGMAMGEAKAKAETARRLHQKMGLSAQEIAGVMEEPVELVSEWLK